MTSHPAKSPSPQNAGRPSLYAEAAPSGNEIQADSILGELEVSRPRHKRRFALFAVALIGASVMGLWQAGGFAPSSEIKAMQLAARTDGGKASDNAAPPAAADMPVPQPVEHRANEAKSQAQEQTADMPAAIVADIAPATVTQEANQSVPVANDPAIAEQDVDNFSKTAGHALSGGAAQIPASGKKKPATQSDTRIAARAPSPAKPQDSSVREAKAARSVPATVKRTEKDGDVEIIAALLKRVSSRTEPPGDDILRKQGAAEKQPRLATAGQKKNKKTAGMQEKIAAKPVDLTESQLKRCGTLGFFESELCRFRVCSGRWGRDPACPESDQVSAVTP